MSRISPASAPFTAVLSWIYGAPPTTQALASHIFGTYTALVYFTPIFGGLVADAWLGKTRTITLGALLMAAGHFLMAFDTSFLLALLLLVLGVGCLKGNLASQVGALYRPGDGRATDAYQLYYIGISGGAFFAPLVCGASGRRGRLALGVRRGRRRYADRPHQSISRAGAICRPNLAPSARPRPSRRRR